MGFGIENSVMLLALYQRLLRGHKLVQLEIMCMYLAVQLERSLTRLDVTVRKIINGDS